MTLLQGDEVQYYLLVFDHATETLREEVELGANEIVAVAAYDAKEIEYRDETRIEVILIGSDSYATVQRTHANYFGERETKLALLRNLSTA